MRACFSVELSKPLFQSLFTVHRIQRTVFYDFQTNRTNTGRHSLSTCSAFSTEYDTFMIELGQHYLTYVRAFVLLFGIDVGHILVQPQSESDALVEPWRFFLYDTLSLNKIVENRLASL